MKWMTVHYYVANAKKYHGKDEASARSDFQCLTETLPRLRVEQTSNGIEVLLPKDRLVVATAGRMHEEQVQMGMRREKNPTATDFGAAVSIMGVDHVSNSHASNCNVLKLGADALGDAGSNPFDTGSTVSEQQLAQKIHEEELQRKERSKQEKLLKGRQAKFEAAAVVGSLKPVWSDKSRRLKERCVEVFAECASLHQQFADNVQLKNVLDEAYSTFPLQVTMLQKFLGATHGANAFAYTSASAVFCH